MANTKLELEISVDSKTGELAVKNFGETVRKTTDGIERDGKRSEGALAGIWKQFAIGNLAAEAARRSVDAFTGFLTDSVKEYADSEKIQNAMVSSMRSVGAATEENIKHYEQLSEAIQKQTTVDDDQAKSLVGLGYRLGLTTDSMDEAVRGAIGLSEAFGIDLEGGMRAVAQATEGNWRSLQQYIPQLRNASTDAEKFALVQKAMADGFQLAQDKTQTAAGKMQQFTNDLNNLKEGVGESIVQALQPALEDLGEWVRDNKEGIIEFFTGLVKLVTALGTAIGAIPRFASGLSDRFQGILVDIATGPQDMQEAVNRYAARDTTAEAIANWNADKWGQESLADGQQYIDIATQMAAATKAATSGLRLHAKATSDDSDRQAEWIALLQEEAMRSLPAADKGLQKLIESMGADLAPAIQGVGYDLVQFGEDVNTPFVYANNSIEKNITTWDELEAKIRVVSEALGGIDAMFKALGVDASKITGPLTSAFGAFQSISGGLSMFEKGKKDGGKQGLIDQISGIASVAGGIGQAVSAAIGLVKGLIEIFKGHGIQEAIDRENSFMHLTQQQKKSIEDLAKSMKISVHEATNQMLADLMRGNVSLENFGEWIDRTREILSDLDRGGSRSKAITDIGKAFTQLREEIQSLGVEGSAKMLDFFDDLKARGLEVPEVTDYINQMTESGFAGYKALKDMLDPTSLQNKWNELIVAREQALYGVTDEAKRNEIMADYQKQLDEVSKSIFKNVELQNIFGAISIKAYDAMYEHQKKVAANQELVDGIKYATQALKGYSAVQKLTQDEFDQFQKSAGNAYAAMIAKGFTQEGALKELAPMLKQLDFLRGQFGYKLDDSTKRMIEEARARDLLGQTTEEMMGEQVKLARDSKEYLREIRDSLKTGGPDIAAASGWDGVVYKPTRILAGEAGPERVTIGPVDGERGGTVIHFAPQFHGMGAQDRTWYQQSQQQFAKQLEDVLRKNVRNVNRRRTA